MTTDDILPIVELMDKVGYPLWNAGVEQPSMPVSDF